MKYSVLAVVALVAFAASAAAQAGDEGTPSTSASHQNEVRELLWSSNGGECTKSCAKAELVGDFHILTQFDADGNVVYQEVENVHSWGKAKSADRAANGSDDGISAMSDNTYYDGEYYVYVDQYFITVNGETFMRVVYSYYDENGRYVKSRTEDLRRFVYIR